MRNNDIFENQNGIEFGTHFGNSSGNLIDANHIHKNVDNGVILTGTSNTIQYNLIDNNGQYATKSNTVGGVMIKAGSNNTVDHNTITTNGWYGIEVTANTTRTGITVSNNLITGNGGHIPSSINPAGVFLASSISSVGGIGVTFTANVISNNQGDGIYIKHDSTNASATGNIITSTGSTGSGIAVNHASTGTFTATNNDWGVYTSGEITPLISVTGGGSVPFTPFATSALTLSAGAGDTSGFRSHSNLLPKESLVSSVARVSAHSGSHLQGQRRPVLSVALVFYLLGAAVGILVMMNCRAASPDTSTAAPRAVATIESAKPRQGDVTTVSENSGPNRSSDAGRSSSVTVEPVLSFEAHSSWIRSVQFSPVGDVLASGGDDGFINLWDAQSGTLIRTAKAHRRRVWRMSFDRTGDTLRSCGDDGLVVLWNAETGDELLVIDTQSGAIYSYTVSPDATLIAAGSHSGSLAIYDATDGSKGFDLDAFDDRIRSVAFSPDRRLLAVGGPDEVLLIDVESLQVLHRLSGQGKWIRRVLFSPDGSNLATASDDGTVAIWDPATGELIRKLSDIPGQVKALAYSPDGADSCDRRPLAGIRRGSGRRSRRRWRLGRRRWVKRENRNTFAMGPCDR